MHNPVIAIVQRSAAFLVLFLNLTTVASAQSHPYPATDEHQTPAWFVDVAPEAGVTVRNVNGGIDSKRYIIESTGSGVAIIDYDRDGWPDIFSTTHQPSLP